MNRYLFLKKKSVNNTANNTVNNSANNTIYIISNINGGGSSKYLKDIISNFNNIKFIYIDNNIKLLSYKYNKDSIIFLQHLLFTNIDIRKIIKIKNNYKCKLIISIHDFYWLNSKILFNFDNSISWHNNYLVDNIIINKYIKIIFDIADDIIHPSKFTYDIFSKYFSINNFKLVSHNDYLIDYTTKCILPIIDNTINIGVLHEYSECKGKYYINLLKEKYINFSNYKIIFHIVGDNIPKYSEGEFFDYIIKYNLHCLTYLNKWGETWCYSLTKGINSGLPIIYNNFGAFKERIPDNIEHYFKVYENENDNDNSKLYNTFEKMIQYIIDNNGKYNNMNKNSEIIYNKYYKNIFNKNIDIKINNKNVDENKIDLNISLFVIYFPQFHSFPENDKNYYNNFTDINNLSLYLDENKDNLENLERPLLSIYNINNLLEYNLENEDIVNKQVDIARSYGINGFAIYYYWFTVNSITNKYSIMENGYANFFRQKLDNFKVFFVWANEDWSNNPSFNISDKIYNVYDINSFDKNSNNLITYFKHENYHKIDNKPILMLHHPWFIEDNKIDLFYNILNNKCIENGFYGVTLILNMMNKSYAKYNNYNFHPNYKNPPVGSSYRVNNKLYLDYNKYIKNMKLSNNTINSIFFDFNNTARFYKPNKLNRVTRVINNIEDNILKYIKKIKNSYVNNNDNKVNNILLINAWNEWGEKMHIEPSEEKKAYYLELIKNTLVN